MNKMKVVCEISRASDFASSDFVPLDAALYRVAHLLLLLVFV